MINRLNKSTRTVYYYTLICIWFITAFVLALSIKAVIALVAILIHHILEKYIDDWALFPSTVIGLLIGGLWYGTLRLLAFPRLEKLNNYRKRFRPKAYYIDLYGREYPRPKAVDFGITEEEIADYNKRFQFNKDTISLLPVLIIAAVIIYLISTDISKSFRFQVLLGAAVFSLSIHLFLSYVNKRISMKHKHYHKIKKYQDALDIHFNIQIEKISH